MTSPPRPTVTAHRDLELRAVVLDRHPLRYTEGPDLTLDRPGHVRAASALVRIGEDLVIVQDDALFLATVEPDRTVHATEIPAGPDGVRLFDEGRGNKADKLDLEAVTLLEHAGVPWLVAFGSGSTSVRERLVCVRWEHGHPEQPQVVDAAPLYEALHRALPDAELNIEGALARPPDQLLLLQRGNGRGVVDAVITVELTWLRGLLRGSPGEPRVTSVTRWNLGTLDGIRLTFTDLTELAQGLLFTGAAEDSPDATRDGAVTGSVVGWLDPDRAAWAPLVDQSDRRLFDKIEGIAPGSTAGEVWLVTDADEPDRPAELLRVRLEGPWPGRAT